MGQQRRAIPLLESALQLTDASQDTITASAAQGALGNIYVEAVYRQLMELLLESPAETIPTTTNLKQVVKIKKIQQTNIREKDLIYWQEYR